MDSLLLGSSRVFGSHCPYLYNLLSCQLVLSLVVQISLHLLLVVFLALYIPEQVYDTQSKTKNADSQILNFEGEHSHDP